MHTQPTAAVCEAVRRGASPCSTGDTGDVGLFAWHRNTGHPPRPTQHLQNTSVSQRCSVGVDWICIAKHRQLAESP